MKPTKHVKTAVLTLLVSSYACAAQTNATILKLDNETKTLLREVTTDHWFNKEAFTSALLGGLLAVGAAWLAHRWQINKEQCAEDEFNRRVLNAIRTELETLREIYDKDAGRQLKRHPDGQPFFMWLYFSQNHFTVYESNAAHIGKINPDLAARIIKVHELIKVLVETFGVNSTYIRQFEQINWALRSRPGDQGLTHDREFVLSQMTAQAAKLKRLDAELHSEAEELFRMFDEPVPRRPT